VTSVAFGLLDQVRGTARGSAYLRAARVQGDRLDRADVGEAFAATDELHAVGKSEQTAGALPVV
jgi:hypothetical protein